MQWGITRAFLTIDLHFVNILLIAHPLIPGRGGQLTSAGIQPNPNLFFEPLDRLENSLGLVTL